MRNSFQFFMRKAEGGCVCGTASRPNWKISEAGKISENFALPSSSNLLFKTIWGFSCRLTSATILKPTITSFPTGISLASLRSLYWPKYPRKVKTRWRRYTRAFMCHKCDFYWRENSSNWQHSWKSIWRDFKSINTQHWCKIYLGNQGESSEWETAIWRKTFPNMYAKRCVSKIEIEKCFVVADDLYKCWHVRPTLIIWQSIEREHQTFDM